MYIALILPICLVLIVALRLLYPEAKRAFQSSLIFFAIASLLQFQNCSYHNTESTHPAQESINK